MRIAITTRSMRALSQARIFLIPVLTASLLIILSCCTAVKAAEALGNTSREITLERLQQGIALANQYLVANCHESGRFVYRRHLERELDYGKKYNMLRHAGTVFALARTEERSPNPEVRIALLRSSVYLLQSIYGDFPDAPDAVALWSIPELISNSKNPILPLQAKLGGTGLALVALSTAKNLEPEIFSLQKLRSLANFIVYMQKPDGSFYSKYFAESGRDDSWTSLYYPGEAMLGLLMLYEHDPDPLWLKTTAKGMAYLSRIRRGKDKIAADHWALLATEKLLRYYNRIEEPPVSRREIIFHAKQICEQILSEQIILSADPVAEGSFGIGAKTCPASTRMEGLMAALAFLPPEEEALRQKIQAAVRRGMRFIIQAQVVDGPFPGAFPFAAQRLLPESEHQKFNRGVREVRIDYVQHALCAMLQYENLFFNLPE